MKYWNKDKEIRRRCWIKVPRSKNLYHVSDAELKRWCQQQPSTGNFTSITGLILGGLKNQKMLVGLF